MKRFDEPDEVVSLPHLSGQVVVLGEVYVGRYVHQPGWSWAEHVRPTVGTPRHGDRVRRELDRFRGLEIRTTGDGFLAMFDGTARGVRCAAAVRDVAAGDDLRIRAGVHSGEVELEAGNLRGVAVHAATRTAGRAEADEVLVSAAAAGLLEGAGVSLEDAGEHELKGLPGPRRLYRLAGV